MAAPVFSSISSPLDADVRIATDAFWPLVVLASIVVSAAGSEAEAARHGVTESSDTRLHSAEWAVAKTLPWVRRQGYVAGRRALRAALHQLSRERAAEPLLSTARGAPQLPVGFAGSISHKRTRAIAIAAPTSGDLFGVDLEERPREDDLARPSIAKRILTAGELATIESLDEFTHRETTLVYFALKEAVYKAIDPLVERYVQFTEVELTLNADGSAGVQLHLPEFTAHASSAAPTVQANWHFDGGYIVALARCTRATADA